MLASVYYYLIAFLAPLFYATSLVIESFLSLAVFKRPLVMVFFVSLTNALFTPLVLLLGVPTIPTLSSIIIYLLIATIDICYLYPYYTALKKTDTSIVSSLFALGKIFVPFAAFILLNETLSVEQYIGFFIIIATSSILSKKTRARLRLNKAFYFMFLSSFLLAIRICLAKLVMEWDHNFINVLVYPNLISGLIPFTFLLSVRNKYAIKRKFPIYKKQFKFFVIIEFLTAIAIATSTIALSKLSPVICTAIEATEPLFVLVIALLINSTGCFHFHEKTSVFKKITCFLLIILGIILTCFSKQT
ncbi:MAG: EamA family transporter [Alphaproteobacteria bacterium]|nr:EamA family transporter [Alphaproteobacteria bacterium]